MVTADTLRLSKGQGQVTVEYSVLNGVSMPPAPRYIAEEDHKDVRARGRAEHHGALSSEHGLATAVLKTQQLLYIHRPAQGLGHQHSVLAQRGSHLFLGVHGQFTHC